jgi:hypothetical protein
LRFFVQGDAIAIEMTPPISFAERETIRTYVESRSPEKGSLGTQGRVQR